VSSPSRREGCLRPLTKALSTNKLYKHEVGVLESLVEPLARGDPESPLRWTCKSTRTLAQELTDRRHPISHEKVAQLLRGLDYRLQGTRKTEEGTDHPDRDAQFRHINRTVRQALRLGVRSSSIMS
jgi:hypothetical protein